MPMKYVLSKTKKNITIFYLKIIIFIAVNIAVYNIYKHCLCNVIEFDKTIHTCEILVVRIIPVDIYFFNSPYLH